MKFLKYIQGNRKGKEAHRIEKQSMDDPFLFEAIEGYDSVDGNHADRIARMRSTITARSYHRQTRGAWKIAAATVGIIVASSAYFILMNHQSSMLTAHENSNEQITLYIPKEYVEQKRLDLIAMQENDPKQKATLNGSVANITNLDEVITSIEPMVIYLPSNYAQLQNREILELTEKREKKPFIQGEITQEQDKNNQQNIEVSDYIKNSENLLAKEGDKSEEQDKNKDKQHPTGSYSHMNQGQMTIVIGANQSYSIVKDKKDKNEAAKMFLADSKDAKTDRTKSPKHALITLKGKIVDSNNEPLTGVTVVKKGTNIGTVTDIDGYYVLKVDSADDIILTANLIGFEKIDIPNPTETKVVALKEQTSTLDEVVITGYGTQKKRDITGAVSSVSDRNMTRKAKRSKSKNDTNSLSSEGVSSSAYHDLEAKRSSIKNEREVEEIKPEPIIGKKEYNKYLDKNRTHTKTEKGEVILRFSVDTKGTPINIEVSKSLSESLDKEAIRLLENGPKWKQGNTTGELKIKY